MYVPTQDTSSTLSGEDSSRDEAHVRTQDLPNLDDISCCRSSRDRLSKKKLELSDPVIKKVFGLFSLFSIH